MVKLVYPKLYVGQAVPPEWEVAYTTRVLRSIADVREFVGSFSTIGTEFEVGIDIRDLDSRAFSSLLKVLEDSKLKLILRVNEPIPDTILSRAGEVNKFVRVEEKSLTECLVGTYSIVAQKIVGLGR